MIEKQTPQVRKERFEFILTVNDNIICQRYFKINELNEKSLVSVELKDVLDMCVGLIDNDLKSKSRIYMWHTCPMVFNDIDEMTNWFSNPNNASRVRIGESLYLRNSDEEYCWDGKEIIDSNLGMNDKEYTDELPTEPIIFKFTFLDNDKVVYSRIWDGNYYPKYVRNGVDLSNKKGKFDDDDILRLSFENSILSHMVSDKNDLVPIIIKEICDVCTVNNNSWYTVIDEYLNDKDNTKKEYPLSINGYDKGYIKKLEKIYKKKTDEYFKSL